MAKKANPGGGGYNSRKPNVEVKFNIKELPWTHKQQRLIQTLQKRSTKCALITGPAGTSKTIVAVYVALQLLKDKKISDITYVRSAVESASSKLGFLPGDVKDKFEVYGIPFQEKLEELLDPSTLKLLREGNRLKTLPINFLRGLNFAGNLVIIDEAQNFTTDELVTAITRLGEHSRVWFLGDPKQSDLPDKHKKDFSNFCEILGDEESEKHGILSFDFDVDDIVRSEFCKYVVKKLKLYEYAEYEEIAQEKPTGTNKIGSFKVIESNNIIPKILPTDDFWRPGETVV